MEYQLYHFGLCCRNLQKSIDFYEGIGCALIKKIDNDGYKVAFLRTGSQVILELNENPLMIEEKYFTKRRGSINSISLKVDNIYEAYKDIEEKGLRIVWKPKEKKGIYQFGLLDEEGMLIKIFNYVDDRDFYKNDSLEKGTSVLKEICLLTSQYEKTIDLYENALGLIKLKNDEGSGDHPKVSFLGNVDEHDHPGAGLLIKEIPEMETLDKGLYDLHFSEREREYICQYGNGYEHLVFQISQQENENNLEWITDPDGNHIRIINN